MGCLWKLLKIRRSLKGSVVKLLLSSLLVSFWWALMASCQLLEDVKAGRTCDVTCTLFKFAHCSMKLSIWMPLVCQKSYRFGCDSLNS